MRRGPPVRTLIGRTLLAAVLIATGSTSMAVAQGFGSGSIGGGLNTSPPAADVARRLIHANLSVRWRGVLDLWRLGDGVKEILPAIQEALGDDDLQIRVAAANVLAKVDPTAKGIAPVLVEALDTKTSLANSAVGESRALADARSRRAS